MSFMPVTFTLNNPGNTQTVVEFLAHDVVVQATIVNPCQMMSMQAPELQRAPLASDRHDEREYSASDPRNHGERRMMGCISESGSLPWIAPRSGGIEEGFKRRGCLCRWYAGHSITTFSPECPVLKLHMNVPADLLGFDFQIERVIVELWL